MKRTTIYLAPELEVLLKSEMLRQNRPMAEIVREAVEA
jgi:predicted DNA-binding protein